ncbi:tetratricopeptide (TPR) repeat protein [Deinococcus soli (ex Cha et al. 2016)]|uniref:Tetratricopeptide (TPR) repeat protein n=1 Tax=Deinococcus soli (ex Cha et al. 2016) TaxID=1309411 RepID=A0AAE4BNZ7_9DEIO|nr:hypothetical protein [Deinococcus soli (ex Cha et al. 2016)]MDR6220087.1 tetratricopeptide (TPR) repeat protein [Deinococcus soli (ex Cha et al. 2016)]
MPSDPTEPLSIEALRTPPEHVERLDSPLGKNLQELPWDDYDWKDFERLTLRLVETEYQLENTRLYGKQGEDQQGIDVIGKRVGQEKSVVLQAKRNKAFNASDVRDVAAQFLHVDKDGKLLPPPTDQDGNPKPHLADEHGNSLPLPKDLADTFILALSCRLDSTRASAAWSTLESDLRAKNITAVLWDQSALELRLKKRPEIVQDFFGMAYVAAFCGEHEAAKLRGTAGHADSKAASQDIAKILNLLETMVQRGVTLTPELQAQFFSTLTSAPVVTVNEPSIPSTDPTEQTLNTIRTLIEAGANDVALDRLGQLESSNSNLTATQQGTIHRLRGHIWYRKGDAKQAAFLFHQAYNLDHKDPASQIAEGLAYLIDGDSNRAEWILDLVQRDHPDREDARSLYILAVAQKGPSPELNALEAALTPNDDAAVINLARYYSNQHDTAAIRRVLSRLDGGPHEHDPHRRLLNAKADLLDVMAELNGFMPEARALLLQRRPEVRQLLTTMAEIIPALKDARMNRALAPEALNVAQVVHSLRGEEEAAIDQGRQALALSPDEHGIRVDVALSYLRLKRPADAARELQVGGDALLEAYPGSRPILAAALRLSGQLDEALAVLTPQLGDPTTGVLDEHVRILLAQGKIPEARQALIGAPDEMQIHLIRADVEQAAGDDPATRQAYEAALRVAPPSLEPHARFLYAQYLGLKQAYEDAATTLEPLPLVDLPSTWLNIALTIAHNANRPTEAFIEELARRGDLTDVTSLHIAMLVAARQGDFQQAIQRGITYLRQRPNEAQVILTLADLYIRIDQRSAARRLLHQIQVNAIDAPLLTYAARIARRLNERTLARDLTYQAYRHGESEDDYVEFLNEMLHAPDEPDPKVVGAEHAVHLRTGSKPEGWWVILTADPQPDRNRGEHALTDDLAQRLLGRRVGETVSGNLEDLTVTAIRSKYVHATKHVLTHTRELFPTSGRLHQYAVGPLEVLPAGLWDTLKRRNDAFLKLTQEIREAKTPVLVLGVGRPGPDTALWEAITASSMEMVTNVGDRDFQQTAEAIAAAPAIMLDPSALVVLNRARLLRELAKTHRLLVTRQTLDDINAAVTDVERDLKRAPLKSMHYEGGRIVFVEEDVAVTKQRLHFLMGIRSFVRKHTRIVPVIQMGRGTPSTTRENAATISTAYGAIQYQVPMLTDDLPLMGKIRQVNSASWTTSAAFTLAMGRSRRWPKHRMEQALLTFLSLGQTILPVSMDTAKAVLQQEDMTFGHVTRRAIRNVTHPWQDDAFAMIRLTQIIQLAVVHAVLPMTRERWIRQALDVAVHERDALIVANAVLDALPRAFHLVYHLRPEVEHIIQTWLHERLNPPQLVSSTP